MAGALRELECPSRRAGPRRCGGPREARPTPANSLRTPAPEALEGLERRRAAAASLRVRHSRRPREASPAPVASLRAQPHRRHGASLCVEPRDTESLGRRPAPDPNASLRVRPPRHSRPSEASRARGIPITPGRRNTGGLGMRPALAASLRVRPRRRGGASGVRRAPARHPCAPLPPRRPRSQEAPCARRFPSRRTPEARRASGRSSHPFAHLGSLLGGAECDLLGDVAPCNAPIIMGHFT